MTAVCALGRRPRAKRAGGVAASAATPAESRRLFITKRTHTKPTDAKQRNKRLCRRKAVTHHDKQAKDGLPERKTCRDERRTGVCADPLANRPSLPLALFGTALRF